MANAAARAAERRMHGHQGPQEAMLEGMGLMMGYPDDAVGAHYDGLNGAQLFDELSVPRAEQRRINCCSILSAELLCCTKLPAADVLSGEAPMFVAWTCPCHPCYQICGTLVNQICTNCHC
jgi:hypothetical protein